MITAITTVGILIAYILAIIAVARERRDRELIRRLEGRLERWETQYRRDKEKK